MLLLVVLAALTVQPSPSPAPTPLKTIVNTRSTALCTTLRQNIGQSVSAIMANDQAIVASKPILVRMAHDFMAAGNVNQAGWGNLNAPAATDHDSAAMQLDQQRLEEIIGIVSHNLQIIDAALADKARFADTPKNDSDKQAVALRDKLLAVKKQQSDTLNVLNGLRDTRAMESMDNRGADVLNLFGLNDGNNAKISGSNHQFDAGPLGSTPVNANDPTLSQTDISNLSASIFGRFYRVVSIEQAITSFKEQDVPKDVVAQAKTCANP